MKNLTIICFTLLLMAGFRSPSDFTVTGKITDENGAPVAGATIIIKGTVKGTNTDSKGQFSLLISSEKATLLINAVGYDPQEVNVSARSNTVNISLKASVHRLEEVVVTGYSVRRKKSITGSSNSPSARGVVVQQPPYHKQKQYDDYNKRNRGFDREGYDAITENRFLKATDNPLSTFSIDVDGASYSNVRRMLNGGQLPPAGAVRIEEMVNYFRYEYPQPIGNDPFSINTEMADCPWNSKHKLLLIGLQGKQIPIENLPPTNLVFLVDVSGSMSSEDKLPLVQKSLKLLADQMRENDRVAIVVYAGNAGMVLPSTPGNEKNRIREAVDRLQAGGSTAGGAGIELAYRIARENFIEEGNNRVILCTDGDFNVGVSSDAGLEELIEKERESGVFLTVLGYGTGNYQDAKMQKLADKGNGNHSYIDNFNEARKVLVNEFGGTVFTIAKDVKLQLEFNPSKVQAYRLIGYENRLLNKEDFNNDKKDAGELGSGHTVTALYEIIPVGVKSEFTESVDPLKYQQQNKVAEAAGGNELLTVKFRYKQPDGNKSKLIEHAVIDRQLAFDKTSGNFRFAAAVAGFGMLLTNSAFKKDLSFTQIWQIARGAKGEDKEGYRSEFIQLVKSASTLAKANITEQEEDLGKH